MSLNLTVPESVYEYLAQFGRVEQELAPAIPLIADVLAEAREANRQADIRIRQERLEANGASGIAQHGNSEVDQGASFINTDHSDYGFSEAEMSIRDNGI